MRRVSALGPLSILVLAFWASTLSASTITYAVEPAGPVFAASGLFRLPLPPFRLRMLLRCARAPTGISFRSRTR